jgi:hypothetical protein
MPRVDRKSTAVAVWSAVLACFAGHAAQPAAAAEAVPASVRACTLEPDSLKRLICFDKEVARYTGQPASTQGAPASPPPPVANGAPPPPAPVYRDPGGSAEAAPVPAAPPKPKHIAARIVSIENFPDALVVHLDNETVWQQIQEATADVNLHPGDTVTIDRELGSYWLSGKGGAAMKVKQRVTSAK